jgi:threonyl-tRNA synthetase
MPVITLPDGTQKQFDGAVTVAAVAASIGAGLAKAAFAGKVNDQLVDTSFEINEDATLSIITDKDPLALDVIRHSTAHLLAQAVKSLFPAAQVTIGPVIENGFYYDFAFSRPFTPDDLIQIEAKMKELTKADLVVTRKILSREEAISFFKGLGEEYKAKIIEEVIPAGQTLTTYQQGDFVDLCRGPHVPSTGKLKAFKLMKVAGAYWRGDSNNEMLQRIYGTAWKDQKSLDEYVHNLEEAEKRDHRHIAKTLDLFHLQEEAPGMVFWHPNGWTIYKQIKNHISDCIAEQGYQEVSSPQLVDVELWKKSGHWDNFHENMFTVNADNDRCYAVKPMNCPCHIMIFKQGLKSYRDLPLRLAEFGCVHRNEASGTIQGLTRVRQFVQDDGHIFCTEDQVRSEATQFIKTLIEIYADFGFNDIIVKLSTRPVKRLGSDELWDKAEGALAEALTDAGLAYEIFPGEGAFYGPKIEFSLKDCLNRLWQCGTLQVDYSMPGRLDAHYIDENGTKKVPVMLHRAIVGSLERFIGVLLEHYAGKLPVWLAPVQAIIMNITDKQSVFCEEITNLFKKHGIRVKSDLRNEKIGFKIREHTLQHIPYLLVVGDREVDMRTVSVRTQQGKDLGSLPIDECVMLIKEAIARRSRID